MESTTPRARTPWTDGERYPFAAIEAKWQERWLREKTFRTPEPKPGQPKSYILVMFPYPSGAGLHVGHPESYVAADILARYRRMKGIAVLHPMGWDAFGLPAEQYAVQTGVHPRLTTESNIANFKRQIRSLGLSYDWDREINTTDPGYYRWTQWIFLKLFGSAYDETAGKAVPIEQLAIPDSVRARGDDAIRRYRESRRLAYQAEVPVNWCPALGTVLANEEIVDGRSERGGHPVERIPLRQWMLRITAYADRLLEDLETVEWPERIKAMQRNWIGKSTGALVDFPLEPFAGSPRRESFPEGTPADAIRVYTTRPDTIFGATFLVLAPEHPLVDRVTAPGRRAAVEEYRNQSSRRTEVERTDVTREKTGVDTGGVAFHPVTGARIPVWIADYVLPTYGTGAIMAVPGHDVRDAEFAEKFGLPVVSILARDGADVAPGDDAGASYIRSGTAEFSLDGIAVTEGIPRINAWLESKGLGRAASTTKLRDWLFSRQRYWGEPIPVVHETSGEVRAVDDRELPLLLPQLEDFQPTGRPEPLLAKVADWVRVEDPDSGRVVLRETNTMPQWAGSCWYYLRYIDPSNTRAPWDPEKERFWMPVDVYIGGAEHAVLHLLYARFWHKVLFDLGLVSTREPFSKLMNQGMILGEDGEKMSKSRGNVINPDDVVSSQGADALRLYEMFMGPLEVDKPWSTSGIQGIARFLDRTWRAVQFADPPAGEDPHEQVRHRTIRKVTEDIERVRHNTAISALMEYVNAVTKSETATEDDRTALALLVSPFAPHLGEEIWSRLGHGNSLALEPWPRFDARIAADAQVTVVVQINGKVRSKFEIEPGQSEELLRARALEDETVRRHLEGREPRKVIVVRDRLVNLVV